MKREKDVACKAYQIQCAEPATQDYPEETTSKATTSKA
jgi:hypothetical protein